MMLAQFRAGSNKAISEIVVAVILIVIVASSLLVFWTITKKIISRSPPEMACLDILQGIYLEKACYLNENEIEVNIKRSFSDFEIDKIRVYFSPSDSIWEISGKKCLDIRQGDRKYGSYYNIIKPGETTSYTFNMTGLQKQEKVKIAVYSKEALCAVGEKKILYNC